VSKPGEPLWSLRRDGRQITCELRSHGEYGWEAQLFRDGEFYAGRRFDPRAHAVAHAEQTRQDLEREGWTPPVCARCGGQGWICEAHQDRPFEHDDCAGAGQPCPDCNDVNPPRRPAGFASTVRFREESPGADWEAVQEPARWPLMGGGGTEALAYGTAESRRTLFASVCRVNVSTRPRNTDSIS
jgi:hypothetical protein